MTVRGRTSVLEYWAGCPTAPNAKWRRFLHVLRRCTERGWRTYLVLSAMPADECLTRPFADLCCEILIGPRARGNFDPRSAARVYRLVRQLRVDVFHCHNDHASPLIGAALAGAPVRVWSKLSMSRAYEEGAGASGIHRFAPSTRISCALAHRILARSNAVRDELLRDGAPPGKVRVSPPGVDLETFATARPTALREELGLADAGPILTAVGHAVPVKGWDLLIAAFAEVAPAVPRSVLLLVGSTGDPHEVETAAALRAQVERLGLGSRVRFLGRRSDIPDVLATTNIFVHPSRSEGQPSAVIEALATGLPCVAARVGGVPEIIHDGENGLLVPREDAPALARAIGALAADAELRRRLAGNARASVARFGIEEWSRGVLAVFEDLLARAERSTRTLAHGASPGSPVPAAARERTRA